MANKLFSMLGQRPNPMSSLMSQMNQLRSNPMQFLMQRKYKIPAGMNNPQDIVQHLLNTGQMSQDQFNTLQQRVNAMNTNH